jgi:type IV pilus assembly protein PilC
MATFTYEAVDPMGRTIRNKIDADSEQVVISRLHEQQFHVLNVKQQSGSASKAAVLTSRGQKVKLQALVVFSRQFATMINAGISIIKCLDILENQTKDEALKVVITIVRKDVKEGATLTDAMTKHPNVFNKLFVNMVKAAEIGGILDLILDRLAGFLEKEMEIKHKVKSAMMYPTIVLVFAFLIVGALFVFVLPRFKDIFTAMNVDMPPTTAFLFVASDFMIRYWWICIGIATAAYIGYIQYSKTTKGRYVIDGLKLKMPVFGELSLKVSVSRFARTFGTLISSGVPMMRSLEIIGDTSGNAVLAEAISNARSSIREGQKISQPLAACGLFPPMVTHMIDVGEETGRLSEMLVKVSEFYDNEVEAMIKGLTSLIEPMLIVFMGVVVGFIAISVMAPIFKLVSSIK